MNNAWVVMSSGTWKEPSTSRVSFDVGETTGIDCRGVVIVSRHQTTVTGSRLQAPDPRYQPPYMRYL